MRRVFVTFLLLAGLISGWSSCTLFQDEGGGDFYGLFIGVSTYANTLDSLEDPVTSDDDAQDLHDALATYSHWNPSRMTLLLNGAATRNNIFNAIGDLAGWSGADDTVLIYYSGHGLNNSNHEYIAPYDTASDYSNAISDDDLESRLAAIPGRVLVILDSCFSGGFLEIATDDRVVMSATLDENQTGFSDFPAESPVHSVFTYFLLEGLAGPADENENGRISALELFDYAGSQTSAATTNAQIPNLAGPAPTTSVAY